MGCIGEKAFANLNEVKKGQKHCQNEANVDHYFPRSKGGTNSFKNAQVLSRKENIRKSNKY
ncbi:HNH endonuclease domain-containing protein [Bacillus cereus]